MEIPKIGEINAATCRACTFQKRWPEFYNYLITTYSVGSFNEKLALYYHNLKEIPVCVVCGKPVKFIGFRLGWRRTCSIKCQGKDPNVASKRTCTMQARYGEDNPGKVKAFQHKMKQTCLERYGIENAGWTKGSQRKIKKTNLERLGVEYPMQSTEVREKSKRTCMERYGAAHNTSAQIVKDKVVVTNLERYGGTGWVSPEILDKILKVKRETFIANSHDVIGYTPEFDWICKCPHPECDKCQERYYVTPPGIMHSRQRVGAELCTRLLPIKSHHSTMELWVCNILDKAGIKYEVGNRSILDGKEIDIYIVLTSGSVLNVMVYIGTQHNSSQINTIKIKP